MNKTNSYIPSKWFKGSSDRGFRGELNSKKDIPESLGARENLSVTSF